MECLGIFDGFSFSTVISSLSGSNKIGGVIPSLEDAGGKKGSSLVSLVSENFFLSE